MFAHSLGNNVFRYFLEWLKLEIAPKRYIQWLDEHIHAYFAVGTVGLHQNLFTLKVLMLRIVCGIYLVCFVDLVQGASLLGTVEAVKGTLSGLTFGLPISEVTSFLLVDKPPQDSLFIFLFLTPPRCNRSFCFTFCLSIC